MYTLISSFYFSTCGSPHQNKTGGSALKFDKIIACYHIWGFLNAEIMRDILEIIYAEKDMFPVFKQV